MTRSVLIACMVLSAVVAPIVHAQGTDVRPQGMDQTHAPTRFDIDAQPVATALRAYSEATGIAVLFDDDLVATRQTDGLHGIADPRDALRILLVGTGLDAHFSSMNAFTVTGAGNVPTGDAVAATASVDDARSLDEASAHRLQAAVMRALCARPDTRPGSFRLALQMWIDEAGDISDIAALAPSDDPVRDTRVLTTLRAMRVPPALHAASPVTLLLRPSAATAACREAST